MKEPERLVRLATVEDVPALTDNLVEATKDQGLWLDLTSAEEENWRSGLH